MKKTAKLLSLVLILALSMCMFVGCGSDEEVYIAGTEPGYPPYEMTDEETGEIIGFDVDLMNAIAEDQGFKVEFQAFEFDGLVGAVKAGNCDIIAAAVTITPDRMDEVDFSDPYMETARTILVKADNTSITSLADLTPDMKVAAQIATSQADELIQLQNEGKIKEAVILNQVTQCMAQLKNGDVEAVFIDKPVGEAYVAKDKDVKMVATGVGEAEIADIGFAVNKGNTELLDKINAGLKNVIDSGKYDELKLKWFS